MDMIAVPFTMFILTVLLVWSSVCAVIGGVVARRTGNLAAAAAAGMLPLLAFAAVLLVKANWPAERDITVINGKAYTAETLPSPPLPPPTPMLMPPADGREFLEALPKLGLEPKSVELCRLKGCRFVLAPGGELSTYGPLKAGDWAYTIDSKTNEWKIK